MVVSRWAARAAAASTVCVALAALPGAASADTAAFDDPMGDSTSVDVSRVRVVHAHAVKVSVRSAVPLDVGQVYTFWIDSGRGRRPTYAVELRANSDFGGRLAVVESFGQRPSRFVACPGMRAHADMFDDEPVSVRIPRSCLRGPRRVRVAVKFVDETTGSVDWVPERRTFGPWVLGG